MIKILEKRGNLILVLVIVLAAFFQIFESGNLNPRVVDGPTIEIITPNNRQIINDYFGRGITAEIEGIPVEDVNRVYFEIDGNFYEGIRIIETENVYYTDLIPIEIAIPQIDETTFDVGIYLDEGNHYARAIVETTFGVLEDNINFIVDRTSPVTEVSDYGSQIKLIFLDNREIADFSLIRLDENYNYIGEITDYSIIKQESNYIELLLDDSEIGENNFVFPLVYDGTNYNSVDGETQTASDFDHRSSNLVNEDNINNYEDKINNEDQLRSLGEGITGFQSASGEGGLIAPVIINIQEWDAEGVKNWFFSGEAERILKEIKTANPGLKICGITNSITTIPTSLRDLGIDPGNPSLHNLVLVIRNIVEKYPWLANARNWPIIKVKSLPSVPGFNDLAGLTSYDDDRFSFTTLSENKLNQGGLYNYVPFHELVHEILRGDYSSIPEVDSYGHNKLDMFTSLPDGYLMNSVNNRFVATNPLGLAIILEYKIGPRLTPNQINAINSKIDSSYYSCRSGKTGGKSKDCEKQNVNYCKQGKCPEGKVCQVQGGKCGCVTPGDVSTGTGKGGSNKGPTTGSGS